MKTPPVSGSERLLYRLTGLVVLLTWAATVYVYPNLPDRMAIHVDLAGTPNGWGSKQTVFLGPGLITGTIAFLLLIREVAPAESFNMPVKITPENRDKQIRLAYQMMAAISLVLALLMAVMQFEICQLALGSTQMPSFLSTGVLIGGLFAVIGYYLWQSIQNQ
ncbi:DUF1648 domain-containing protein [Rudanella paleaurantiibacter]|uniref:DUF1648 domain-containing protein n=1 Tax=Rudanella paleaurantiibacter TaxID=2614655 RepID=A0A7J5U5X6_9BACT|nr:DUF1648 domain-containing protein [Rudanella paleaurantiibacter]KAB7733051.1 DUF1648 domain-containing protein [Rudanella paleaurantiibacter]